MLALPCTRSIRYARKKEMIKVNGQHRFTSKQDAIERCRPVWCCMSCRMKHDAPMLAQCTGCGASTAAIKSTPGIKRNTYCPDCHQPKLKNKHVKPLACMKCHSAEFQYFHSTTEFNVFAELAMLQDHGKIKDLKTQVSFPIVYKGDKKPICTYIADMTFTKINADGTETEHVFDVKGHKSTIDAVFKLKKKLVEKHYPGVIIEIIIP